MDVPMQFHAAAAIGRTKVSCTLQESSSGTVLSAARPFRVGTRSTASSRVSSQTLPVEATATAECRIGLAEIAGGPYIVLASMLDAGALYRCDAACRSLRMMNRSDSGPWRALGANMFPGLELAGGIGFEDVQAEQRGKSSSIICPRELEEPTLRRHQAGLSEVGVGRVDWKMRFHRFRSEIVAFCPPFSGTEISAVAHTDEVAYFQCRIRTEVFIDATLDGIYLEAEVVQNPGNLSLAVVAFEAGGCSSVTFSPDMGAVIRERKVRESPRKVEGAYIQPLPPSPNHHFHGRMGLYLHRGRLAFFRRNEVDGTGETSQPGAWECTGFVSDLGWAEGGRLTPCVAFCDEGTYRVRIVGIGRIPPLQPEEFKHNSSDTSWSGFDWEVGPPEGDDAAARGAIDNLMI